MNWTELVDPVTPSVIRTVQRHVYRTKTRKKQKNNDRDKQKAP